MEKIIVFLFLIYFLALINEYIQHQLNMESKTREIEERADYIISLMEKYREKTGNHPKNIEDILEVKEAKDSLMYDYSKIPGKGYFIIYNGVDNYRFRNILVVGDYVPPNIIYFPKINKKEVNSTYFSDSF